MLALKIIAALLGIAFSLFGYFIYFREKYSLINGFERELRAGKRTEAYAKKVGLTEFVIGIVCLLAAIALAIFT